jgi:hypothetical protein
MKVLLMITLCWCYLYHCRNSETMSRK